MEKNLMNKSPSTYFLPRLIFGVSVILIGAGMLLENTGLLSCHIVSHLWPLLFILFGAAAILRHRNAPGAFWGIFLIFLGVGFFLDQFHIISFHVWDFWPMMLVFWGIAIISRSSRRKHHGRVYVEFQANEKQTPTASGEQDMDSDSYIKALAIMGGYRRASVSSDFRGGELTAVMGGLQIDLRQAHIQESATLDVLALMGGIELRVPQDWRVVAEVTPLMGGIDDKTILPTDENAKRLYIKGTLLMGGIEIKN
jgi:predicted membrane protein